MTETGLNHPSTKSGDLEEILQLVNENISSNFDIKIDTKDATKDIIKLQLSLKKPFKDTTLTIGPFERTGGNVTYPSFKDYELVFPKLPSVENLYVTGIQLKSLGFLKQMQNIAHLSLIKSTIINGDEEYSLNNIEELNLEDCYTRNNSLEELINKVKDKLKVLSYRTGKLKKEDILKLTKLKSIKISGEILEGSEAFHNSFSNIKDSDLEIIGQLNIKNLIIGENNYRTNILEKLYNFKKRGLFKKLTFADLSTTGIEWDEPEAGNIAHELSQKHGLEIRANTVRYVPPIPKIDQGICALMNQIVAQTKLSQKHIDLMEEGLRTNIELVKNNLLTIAKDGYTSSASFTIGPLFFKLDDSKRLDQEYKIYNLDLGNFITFRPQIKTYSTIEDVGVLILENVKYQKNPSEKTLSHEEVLYIMSIFHKNATKYLSDFSPMIDKGVHGVSHSKELKEPHKNKDGQGLIDFMSTGIDSNLITSIINTYRHIQTAAKCVTHGDIKKENFVNGYLVDYAMAGIEYEVDELAYYFSDANFKFELPQFHQQIDQYIKIRANHDEEFKIRSNEGYGKYLHSIATEAFLSKLVLRLSVMNKRNILDPDKYEQRQYYQHRINQILKEGRFT